MTGLVNSAKGTDEQAVEGSSSSRLQALLYGYAAVAFVLIVVHLTFTNRTTWGDEDGLYNAIYMFQRTGKVTYPLHLQPGWMTVHPPLHYFTVGVVAKMGLQVFHAAAVPHVLIAFVIIAATVTSAFSRVSKFAVLTGFTLATLVYTPLATIMPDAHVAFAWFCGLVLLESGRIANWDNRRLFLGSFFIAYASGLHYWAGPALLMLPMYFVHALVRPRQSKPWTKLLPLVGGTLLFYVPYAYFFIVPDFDHIVQTLRGTNFGQGAGGGMRASFSLQMSQMHDWVNRSWPVELPWIGKLAFAPVETLHVPPIAWAIPVLLLTPSLRGMALEGAILPLFVLLMVPRKGGLFYMAPELTLYAIALCLLFFSCVEWGTRLAKRLGKPMTPFVPYAVATCVAAVILVRSAPAATMGLTRDLRDWDVARAANQAMIGRNAQVVINNDYIWYTAGGTRIYWVVTPLTAGPWGPAQAGPDFLPRIDRKRNFDSIILLNDWFANAPMPFPEYYMDGILNVRGFYFPGRHNIDQILPVLHLTLKSGLRKEGYGYDRDRSVLNHYVEDAKGPWIFVTFKAYLDPPDWPQNATYIHAYFMQQPLGREPFLFTLVTSRENWLRDRPKYAALAAIRDEVPMSMSEITVADLIRNSRIDQKIEVMTNQADVKELQ
jgi:hypothetical protein